MTNQVFDSYFSEVSNNGKPGFTGTYWNNMDLKGEVAAIQQVSTPFNLTTVEIPFMLRESDCITSLHLMKELSVRRITVIILWLSRVTTGIVSMSTVRK